MIVRYKESTNDCGMSQLMIVRYKESTNDCGI